MKSAVVILAHGFEEVEAVTAIDFLRRAGISVTTVALDDKLVEGAHGICLKADVQLDKLPENPDAVIIPGGMPGSAHIAANKTVIDLIRNLHDQGQLVAAICAAPALVLGAAEVLKDKRFTCYPGFEDQAGLYGMYSPESVVCDENIITANGVGSAAEFSKEIIAYLLGVEKAGEVMSSTLQSGYY